MALRTSRPAGRWRAGSRRRYFARVSVRVGAEERRFRAAGMTDSRVARKKRGRSNSWIVIQWRAVHYAGISHMKYFVGFAILAGCAAWAQQQTKLPDQGFTDTPILPGLKWHVHDPARPHPPVVT